MGKRGEAGVKGSKSREKVSPPAVTPNAEKDRARTGSLDDNNNEEDNGSTGKRFNTDGSSVSGLSSTSGGTRCGAQRRVGEVNGGSATGMWACVVKDGLNVAGQGHQIKKFVKETLFRHVKFFVNHEEVMWSADPASVCQFVVKGLHVGEDAEVCRKWWHVHSHRVVQELNRKRSDVVAGMKKVFIGKNLRLVT